MKFQLTGSKPMCCDGLVRGQIADSAREIRRCEVGLLMGFPIGLCLMGLQVDQTLKMETETGNLRSKGTVFCT